MLTVLRNKYSLDFESFLFPAGEIGIKIKNTTALTAKTNFFAPAVHQTIVLTKPTSEEVIKLFLLVDALKRIDDTPIVLALPYIPYGRQDRVCNFGESFSLKVFGDLINQLNFKSVVTVDPHSHVTEAVINNLKVIKQIDVISSFISFILDVKEINSVLVAPDVGAAKKTAEIANFLGLSYYLQAEKVRDLSTGNITSTLLRDSEKVKGKNVFVADDICDGGKTFIELAKVCKNAGCNSFSLYITHGIFSKGVNYLFENGIDKIYTTNSYLNSVENFETSKISILSLNNHPYLSTKIFN